MEVNLSLACFHSSSALHSLEGGMGFKSRADQISWSNSEPIKKKN